MSRDQGLVERIESLEEEVTEQRLLLRYAMEKFGSGLSDQKEEKPSVEVGPVRRSDTSQTASTEEPARGTPSSGPIRSFETNSTKRKAPVESAAEEDEGRGFGTLAELFRLRGWEWWLNKVGIGLLLFGVVFLFKFSVDQGWLVPELRVGFGLALGAMLVWLGLRVYGDRRAFSQSMLGGGIGTFYITGFAAFQLYALVPYALAFAFLMMITLLALALSIRQNEASLSTIGAAGGFGTPFLLYDGSGGMAGLVLYTVLILAGIVAIYLYKGWRSLLLFSAVGVWTVFFAGYSQSAGPPSESGLAFLQFGALFATLTLWLVPVFREVMRQHRPDRWPVPETGRLVRTLFDDKDKLLHPSLPAHLLSCSVPLVGLAFTQEIWNLSAQPLGWIALVGAATYATVAVVLRRIENGGYLYYTNALTSLLLSTLAAVLVLEGNALFFTLAAEAVVLHLVARRLSDRIVTALAHGLFFSVGVWLFGRISIGVGGASFGGATDMAFLNVEALLDLSVVALAFAISTRFASIPVARVYRIAAHVALLGLIFRELISLPVGDTAIFLSWAAYAAVLLLLSTRYPQWGTVAGSHALWSVVGFWFAGRLAWGLLGWEAMPVFNFPAIADLGVICLLLLTSMLTSPGRSAVVYRVAVHATVLAWLWRELGAFQDGAAYVTVSWGIYAAAVLVLGLRKAGVGLVRAGVVMLFLVVCKLFLVDLVWVGAIWRILLFLGFGGLFLVLSYYLQALWKSSSIQPKEPTRNF